jgi:CRISPR-associated protein (TIGR02710 family)
MNNESSPNPNRFLVATVGGAPEPLVASLLHWHPLRVIFIVSRETRSLIEDQIVPLVRVVGWPDFDAGRWESFEITDAQDYSRTFDQLRRLDTRVAEWQRNHRNTEIIADFTGGTKAMSAALALAAGRWPCRVSYVGGTERTKDGVGVVASGKEQIVHAQNPWNTLGILALDEARLLLEKHSFGAAASLLRSALIRVSDPARKDELNAVATLADALADWDRFQHRSALEKLEKLTRHTNNLETALGREAAQRLLQNADHLRSHLKKLINTPSNNGQIGLSRELIFDLLANAQRRLDEERWDDATARLYRVLEAIAQLQLIGYGYCDTGSVPVDKLPEPLRTQLQTAADNGVVKLGLQDAWRLLALLNNAVGLKFQKSDLADRTRSPLTARNQSILAHGFAPVSGTTATNLFDAALQLLGIGKAELPQSPVMTIHSQT